MKKKKIAFVIQRYGLEVNGGAEYICRLFAEKLKDRYDIEVLTTCAIDHYAWRNEYAPGVEKINGVTVRRFPVVREREMQSFAEFCNVILHTKSTPEQQEQWLRDQGPDCPELIEYITTHSDDFDKFIFIPYLYYQSYFGLLAVKEKAILMPAAHDEPFLYLDIFRRVFQEVGEIAFLTHEEADLVRRTFNLPQEKGKLVGVGIDSSEIVPEPVAALGDDPYVLYVGRIEEGKGCLEMFDFFRLYKQRHPGPLKLVLVGKANMIIPEQEDIISLGFVSEGEKRHIMQQAQALIMPSQYESLSLVLLESMNEGVPVLVNGKCEVLKGHCRRSNAGLWYEDYFEFELTLGKIMDPNLRSFLSRNAEKYIETKYRWDHTIEMFNQFLT